MIRSRLRVVALVITAAVFVAVTLVGQEGPKLLGDKMKVAADKFLASLSPELKQKTTFGFSDLHRTKWYFTPQQDKEKKFTRKGVRLEELSDTQKAAAMELLKTGLSKTGYEQATAIIGLETLLGELEGPKGAMVRNPNWYFVSIFGEPSATGKWGWRFEGHHLSINYTLDKGEVVSLTPMLFGVNPAEVKAGNKKGLRVAPEIEDAARKLIKSLTPDQRKLAEQPMPENWSVLEIKEGQPKADVGKPVGLPFDKFTDAPAGHLGDLLAAYIDRMPPEIDNIERRRAHPGKIHFAYWGSPEPGKPYAYRIQHPEFVIEFLNVQTDSAKNPANHIHSSYRRLPGDLGIAE